MTCVGTTVPARNMRPEGLTELQSDLVLQCTGGSPTAAGAALPVFQILAVSNTTLTNRVVPVVPPTTIDLTTPPGTALQLTDALLVLDETPPASQVACVPATGAVSCPAVAGAAGQPNVFQGAQLQPNVIVFRNVPIDPPGSGTRTIRISNIRADSTQVPLTPLPAQVQMTTQIFDGSGNLLDISNATQITGVPQPDFTFAVRTVTDGAVSPLSPALIVTPSMVPQTNPGDNMAFNVKFTEGFADAFKRRDVGTSGANPLFLANQAVPGANFDTESGFFNSSFPDDNNLSSAGLSDSGTRLMLVLTNLPNNMRVWASGRDVAAGTTNFDPDSPHALLIYTDLNGAGPFSKNSPPYEGFADIYPTNGVTTIVWEVVAADPTQIESLSFTIKLVAPNGVPDTGTALANGTLGPIYPGVPIITTTPDPPPVVQELPSFEASAALPVPAFRLVPSLSVADLTTVSAASYGPVIAPGSLVATFGSNLAPAFQLPTDGPALTIGGTTVSVVDNTGTQLPASLLVVSPGQVNFIPDPATKPGEALVNVMNAGQTVASGTVLVNAVAPGLFSVDGSGTGIAAGSVEYSGASGNQTAALASYDPLLGWQPVAINVSNAQDLALLTLYGTGIRGRSDLSKVSVTIGGKPVAVTFAGAQGDVAGLDQVIVGPLPTALQGGGIVPVVLTVDGSVANKLTVKIQ